MPPMLGFTLKKKEQGVVDQTGILNTTQRTRHSGTAHTGRTDPHTLLSTAQQRKMAFSEELSVKQHQNFSYNPGLSSQPTGPGYSDWCPFKIRQTLTTKNKGNKKPKQKTVATTS